MVRYVAYNKLYQHGKCITPQAFINTWAETPSAARSRSNRTNAQWNKVAANKKQGYHVKTVVVKKVKR